MAHGVVGANGQRCVEQEDALFGPVGEITVAGDGHTYVLVQFFEDVDEAGRRGDAFGDGEAKAVSLSGAVIGILTEQDDLDLFEGGGVEGVEDEPAGGIDGAAADLFVFQEGDDLAEIRFGEFLAEGLFPAVFYFYFHR